jgi:hypothetical protein
MFWEDHYRRNPVDARRTERGEVVYTTGDPLIDKWERELEMGLEPDLTEGLSPEEREKEHRALERIKARKNKLKQVSEELGEGFTEDYSQMSAELPVIGSQVRK